MGLASITFKMEIYHFESPSLMATYKICISYLHSCCSLAGTIRGCTDVVASVVDFGIDDRQVADFSFVSGLPKIDIRN